MNLTIILFITRLFKINQSKPVYFSKSHWFIKELYLETEERCSADSKFFAFIKQLYNFNQEKHVYFSQNHIYVKFLMQEVNFLKQEQDEMKKSQTPIEHCDNTKKAALLIGISYANSNNPLVGAESDVLQTKNILIEQFGFTEENIEIQCESLNSDSKPTYRNILAGIERLVEKSQQGYGKLWFQFSGHGVQVRDRDGDEIDGWDESFVTSDYLYMVDDELRQCLVNAINPASHLFCLIDCCHSGTMMDLQFTFSPFHRQRTIYKTIDCDNNVVALSSCSDNQRSKETEFLVGEWNGGLTKNFIALLSSLQESSLHLGHFLQELQGNMKKQGYKQTPQISSSRPLSKECKFDFV
jgi:hypothetical protein